MERLKGLLSLRGRRAKGQISRGEVDQEARLFQTRLDSANGVTIKTEMGDFYVTGFGDGVFLLDLGGSEGSTVNHPKTRDWAIGLANTAREGR